MGHPREIIATADSQQQRQIQTLRQELRDANTGMFSRRCATIRLPPHENFAKIFRSTRLQHSGNTDVTTVTLSNVTTAIRPQFGWYNFISITAYGPVVPHSGYYPSTVGSGGVTAYKIESPEIYCQAYVNFTSTSPTLSGPTKLVAPGGGRRGVCHWHWSDADQSVAFTDSDSVNLFKIQMDSESGAVSNDDLYIDVTVCGWGKPGDSLRQDLMKIPRFGVRDLTLQEVKDHLDTSGDWLKIEQ